MKSYENIGNMVYFMRLIRGISQTELGQAAGVTQSTIAKIEGATPKTVSARRLRKVLHSVNVQPVSIEDDDLLSFFPDKLRLPRTKAICASLDAEFSSMSETNTTRLLIRMQELGLDVRREHRSYIPSRLIHQTIVRAFSSVEAFLDPNTPLREGKEPWQGPLRSEWLSGGSRFGVKDHLDEIAEWYPMVNPLLRLAWQMNVSLINYPYILRDVADRVQRMKFLEYDGYLNAIETISWNAKTFLQTHDAGMFLGGEPKKDRALIPGDSGVVNTATPPIAKHEMVDAPSHSSAVDEHTYSGTKLRKPRGRNKRES